MKATEGGHFYTLMVQRRAIEDMIELMGSRVEFQPTDAKVLEHYHHTLSEMDERLEAFWNPTGADHQEGGRELDDDQAQKPDGSFGISGLGKSQILSDCLNSIEDRVLKKAHILPTLDRLDGQPKPFQTDTSVLLAINHTARRGQQGPWAPWSERSLATLDRLVDVFTSIYQINHGKSPRDGIAIGRYPVSYHHFLLKLSIMFIYSLYRERERERTKQKLR